MLVSDLYGATTGRNEFFGRGRNAFSTYSDTGNKSSVVQLPLGAEALRSFNDFFGFSVQNFSIYMFDFDSRNHLAHTQVISST